MKIIAFSPQIRKIKNFDIPPFPNGEISKIELFTETSLFINSREFVIITSYKSEIPYYDVIIEPVGRAPPVLLLS